MDLSAINLPSAYNLTSHQHPQQSDHHQQQHHHPIYTTKPRSAFHRHQPTSMPSPPELMHDSEEDEEESTGSPIMTAMQLDVAQPSYHHSIRKSTPHRSPAAVKDAIQASAVDKSVVFQLDVRSHPFFPASTTSSARMSASPASSHDQVPMCPECKLTNCCGMACTSRVICGESLLTALRKRVAQARSEQQPRRRQRLALSSRSSFKRTTTTTTATRKSTHIDIPRVSASSRHHYHSSEEDDDADDDYTEVSAEDEQEKRLREIRRRPWIDHSDQTTPSPQPASPTTPQQPSAQIKDHSQEQPALRKRSPPAGRPSRVKGPCQACQESSDGCMRKAFNWPFPTSSVYNDKGRKFVYLCNKCGLR